MRPTWLILGLIVIVGTVAYLKLAEWAADEEAGAGAAAPSQAPGGVALQRPTAETDPEAQAAADALAARDERATELLAEVREAHQVRDRSRYDRALERLQAEAWDAPSARVFAEKLGWATLEEARRRQGAQRMKGLDRARRLLSRAVYLPGKFSSNGQPTKERGKLIAAIEKANLEVMTWGRRKGGGLAGVTRSFEVPPGWAPVQIVSREKLKYGHNVLLFWNHAGNLDPRRLRAGEVLLLSEDELTVHVHLGLKRLGVFLGDWFVKEFRVGVGREDRPTPTGAFRIDSKMENPDWWGGPQGLVPALDPKNELGSAWMPFFNEALPVSAGFGIHGTNRPQTVGTRCSNGCVRLLNEEATELYWWVRTASAGGSATRVFIGYGP